MAKVKRGLEAENDRLGRLAEVLWTSGSIETPFAQAALRKAGFDLTTLSPADIHHAEDANRDRLRNGFLAVNSDSASRLKVVVAGDAILDPGINASHPVKGAAVTRQVQAPIEAAAATDSPPRSRNQIFGHPATKVYMTMGALGFSFEQAMTVIGRFGVQTTEASVRTFLRAGAKGERGGPAKLTDDQISQLKQIAASVVPLFPADKPATKKPRYALLGFPVTAVLRWMGKAGWTIEQATKVVTRFGIDCSPTTIAIFVKAGANGQRGDPAPLTDDQIKRLNRARKAKG